MKLTLVTAPAVEPVSVAEAKAHLRVDISEDDTLIGTYITAAREYAEAYAVARFVTQTWEVALDTWPGRRLELPWSTPLQSVTSITYTDRDGNTGTVSSSDYIVDTRSEPGAVMLKGTASWPAVDLREVNGVVVRFVTGYGLEAAVPERFKAAIKLIVGTLYENREDVQVGVGIVVQKMPWAAADLLRLDRVWA